MAAPSSASTAGPAGSTAGAYTSRGDRSPAGAGGAAGSAGLSPAWQQHVGGATAAREAVFGEVWRLGRLEERKKERKKEK